jgi:2-phosphoglycerate kinase
MKNPILIVIRGNSGSGKSTVAKGILAKLPDSKISYIEQDYIRRTILREQGSKEGANIKLIEEMVKFSLKNSFHVVLEGILTMKLYGKMLKRISKLTNNSYFFYFDLPYEETFKRHKSKKLSKQISPEKHKSWYLKKDVTNFKNEKLINEKMKIDEIVNYIIKETKLK